MPNTPEVPLANAPNETPRKREYVPPKLELLGTIRELTRGLGSNQLKDGHHPPGQNKSIMN